MHCEDPGCLKACPAPGAIVQYSNGIVDFVKENCIGCGYCVKGCPFNIPRISQADHKAYKCTLCSDRVAVGQGPACQKACPTQAIVFGTKDEMKKWADRRIADLQVARLRQGRASTIRQAWAARTSCTCCITPTSRSSMPGLANNPRISPLVELWKGVSKYAGLAVIGLTAAAGVLHHVLQGPEPRLRTTMSEQARTSSLEPSHERPGRGRRAPSCASLFRQCPHQPLDRGSQPSCCCCSAACRCSIRASIRLSGLFGGGADRALAPSLDRGRAGGRLPRPVPALLLAEPAGVHRLRLAGPHPRTCWLPGTTTCPRSANTTPARSSCSGRSVVLVVVLFITGVGLWEAGLG